MEWEETARWIKFEEDVEEGSGRWGRPHISALTIHSLIDLRRGLEKGTVSIPFHWTVSLPYHPVSIPFHWTVSLPYHPVPIPFHCTVSLPYRPVPIPFHCTVMSLFMYMHSEQIQKNFTRSWSICTHTQMHTRDGCTHTHTHAHTQGVSCWMWMVRSSPGLLKR